MSLHICIATMALNDLSFRDFSHVVISCLLVVPSYFCWPSVVGLLGLLLFMPTIFIFLGRSTCSCCFESQCCSLSIHFNYFQFLVSNPE